MADLNVFETNLVTICAEVNLSRFRWCFLFGRVKHCEVKALLGLLSQVMVGHCKLRQASVPHQIAGQFSQTGGCFAAIFNEHQQISVCVKDEADCFILDGVQGAWSMFR